MRIQFVIRFCFQKTSVLKQYHYNENYKICADREWIYKVYKQGNSFKYVDVDICYFDTTGYSLQESNKKLFMDERFYIQKKYFYIFFIYKNTMRKIREILKK